MLSDFLRERAAKLRAVAEAIVDIASKVALIDMADELGRMAAKLDGEELPKTNGAE